MACSKEFLSFEPTDTPPWRKRLPEENSEPNISDMLTDIITYRQCYVEAKSKGTIDEENKKKADLELLLKYLLNVQTEECIGLSDAGTTQEVVYFFEDSWDELTEEQLKTVITQLYKALDDFISDKLSYQYSISDTEAGKSRRQTGKGGMLQTEGTIGQSNSCITKEKVQICEGSEPEVDIDKLVKNITRQVSSGSSSSEDSIGNTSELPSYPSSGGTEDKIASYHKYISQHQTLKKDLRETLNLYRGYKHLAQEVDKLKKKERHLYLGLLDVDSCILETHKILMDGDKNIKPGIFSIYMRDANFQGIVHTYPRFDTIYLAQTAVQTLVDKYVEMVEEIRQIPDGLAYELEKTQKSFKCASVFLFGFLTLHPFGDGNGRLARLLCSYSLLTVSPFLTPIFNVFSSSEKNDYVEALVEARQGLELPDVITTEQEAKEAAIAVLHQKPSDLCSLIIESNRCMWREYLTKLNLLANDHI